MTHIVLINPNTCEATTAMMVGIARARLQAGVTIEGMTALSGVPMILDGQELLAAAAGVIDMGERARRVADGIIIGAFGDPGIEQVRTMTDRPVVGLCQASVLEAAAGGRRFGIATVTPKLVDSFLARIQALGVGPLYTGTRLTTGDPRLLASDAEGLADALATAVRQSLEDDGAEAVIIGGGPLGRAAEALALRFRAAVIAPIPTAVDHLLRAMRDGR